MNEAYYTKNPDFKSIALKAFPSYKGNIFKLDAFSGPMNLSSYWDGGSRNYYVILNLRNLKSKDIPENGTPWSGNPYRISKLPEGIVVVRHAISQGKDLGITIYVNPENMAKMLPQAQELDWAEKVVLTATRSLKSSYAGIKDYRFHEALKDTGITKPEWDVAKERLITKKMLNRAGSITDEGRNAIGDTKLWNLKRPKELDKSSNIDSMPV